MAETSSIALAVANPQALLNAIASNYKSTARVLMEYVDNAIDAAEVARSESSEAGRSTRIAVDIDLAEKNVWVRDNNFGMSPAELARIVHGVGDSRKREVAWLNGQFGFGVHAFRAACEGLKIYSAVPAPRGKPPMVAVLSMNRSASNVPLPSIHRLEDIASEDADVMSAMERGVFNSTDASLFPRSEGAVAGAGLHGTVVVMKDIQPVWFDTVRAQSVAREIELHFEGLLSEGKTRVTVSQSGGKRRRDIECGLLDYKSLAGNGGSHFSRVIPVQLEGGEKAELKCEIVVSPTAIQGKAARFFRRGRCISTVSETRSFIEHSEFGAQLWEHPGVCGFIEVNNALEPVLTRDEFKRTASRRLVYEALRPLEAELKAALDQAMDGVVDNSMAELEDILSDSLDALIKMDEMENSEEDEVEEKDEKPDDGPIAEEAEPNQVVHDEVVYKPVLQQTKEARQRRQKKRPNGAFSIRFVRSPEGAGAPKRSFAVDGVVYINVDHEHFKLRVALDRQNRVKMGDRMASYLANELALYYRNSYYERFHKPSPEDRQHLFEDLLDSATALEASLNHKLSRVKNLPPDAFGDRTREP